MNIEDYEKLKQLDAFSRHKKFINDYFQQIKNKQNNSSSNSNNKYSNYKSDYEILKENHQFLRDDDNGDDNNSGGSNNDNNQLTWEQKLAKKYYDRLFKEYAIIDLSHYKSGEIGLRWRIESEVISGRGQFTCSNKKCTTLSTTKKDELKSFEVPFSYKEQDQNKLALVKVVLCPLCSKLLNYSNIKKKKRELKEYLKNNKQSSSSSSSSSSNKSTRGSGSNRDKKKRKHKERDDSDSDSDSNSNSSDSDSDNESSYSDDNNNQEYSNENINKRLKADKDNSNTDTPSTTGDEDIFNDMFI